MAASKSLDCHMQNCFACLMKQNTSLLCIHIYKEQCTFVIATGPVIPAVANFVPCTVCFVESHVNLQTMQLM